VKVYLVGLLLLVVVGVLVAVLNRDITPLSPIKTDEKIVFYPTLGWPVDDSPQSDWYVQIHGCIFETGSHSIGVKLIRELTGLDDGPLDADEANLFRQRAELFAVDNERGKAVPIRIGEQSFTLPESNANGHFQQRLRLTDAQLAAASEGRFRELQFSAVLRKDDRRHFSGTVHLVPRPPIVHVISDIDDTIKISEVRDKVALLKNTFSRPFRPVPGMSDLYQRWDGPRLRFHYVSASPWQLFSPLEDFRREHHFPAGTFHMKLFRIKDRSALNLFGGQEEYKRGVIEPLLKQFPLDRFVLVGDSGEQDARIYAALTRDYPRQVAHILIRNVTDEPLDVFRETFAEVPDDRWQVFRDPSDVTFQIPSEASAPAGTESNSQEKSAGDHQP
jgi:uncharacterized protein DUF2183